MRLPRHHLVTPFSIVPLGYSMRLCGGDEKRSIFIYKLPNDKHHSTFDIRHSGSWLTPTVGQWTKTSPVKVSVFFPRHALDGLLRGSGHCPRVNALKSIRPKETPHPNIGTTAAKICRFGFLDPAINNPGEGLPRQTSSIDLHHGSNRPLQRLYPRFSHFTARKSFVLTGANYLRTPVNCSVS